MLQKGAMLMFPVENLSANLLNAAFLSLSQFSETGFVNTKQKKK